MMRMSKENRLVLSLGILCFQGFGIRIFSGVMQGAIVLWLVILIILNKKYIRYIPVGYWLKVACIVFLYFLFCTLKGVTCASYLIVAWLSMAIVLTPYYLRQANFVGIMRKLTRFCMYYSLCHVPIMLLFKSAITTTPFEMHPKTFLYLFFFNEDEGFAGMNRIQGFCWEPSCWNLLLDLNLLFTLYFKEKKIKVLLAIASIVTIMSTTGLVVMSVIICLNYMLNLKGKQMIKACFAILIFFSVLGPFVYSNVTTKLESGSGNARLGDFAIASAVIEEHPFVGIDMEHLTSNILVVNARENAWTSSGDKQGYMEQGMTNSFAALFVQWGVPITILFFVLMFCMPLIEQRKLKHLFIIVVLSVLMGTPIANTGFFFMFIFSTILIQKRKSYVIVKNR